MLTQRLPRVSLIIASAVVCVLAGCSSSPSSEKEVTVRNCGAEVTVVQPPHRVFVSDSAPVATLSHLGVLDTVTARAGVYPPSYFDATTQHALDAIPSLTDRVDAKGHLQISKEQVLADNPDVVLGSTDTVNRQTLASHNIPVIEEPAFCDAIKGSASWNDVWDQISLYGTIFDRQQQASSYIDELKKQLAHNTDGAAGRNRSVAVMYPEVGTSTAYAYGSTSMSHPIVESAGLRNVFADQDKRVFEVSAEELVARNPDVIIALYTDGDPNAVVKAIENQQGASSVTAVKNKTILPLLLNYAEPATPLAVEGVGKINAFLRGEDPANTPEGKKP